MTLYPTKVKILFPCCKTEAFGLRGAHIVGGDIWRYAQCPRCGKRVNLEPVPWWGKEKARP